MKILITGANGFIGKNLIAHLRERKDVELLRFCRGDGAERLALLVAQADFIFHLAGINRPENVSDFKTGNANLTQQLCDAVRASGRQIPLLFTSSTQASNDSPYGTSKKEAEDAVAALKDSQRNPVSIIRLPNVFGKWSRPNYNSVVATFCHNISRGLPVQINDPDARMTLVYIDDVIRLFIDILDGKMPSTLFVDVSPQYTMTVGELSAQLHRFRESRDTMISEPVGTGLVRALYSTYLSYVSPENFTYEVPKHGDPRGVFVEMLKTQDSGQFSYFTAHPGITRGGHYHHSKTEKFLVIKGTARFKFRHIMSGEFYELNTVGDKPQVVETVPGWTHDITNIGSEEMIVMLWANEIFDRELPDTYALPVGEQMSDSSDREQ